MTLWGSRVTFEVSSADPGDEPVWVDLSEYVLARQPIAASTGRQNDLDQTEPGQVSFLLNNNDDRFTFGNTTSPYAAWWGPGRKCRLRETVGSTDFDLFTGYLQVPTETIVVPGSNQTVSVAAVDRLGRLAASEPFISTLTASIVSNGGSSLAAHLPLNELSGPTLRDPRPNANVVLYESVTFLAGSPSLEWHVPVRYGEATALPGDELLGLIYDPLVNPATNAAARWWLHSGTLPSTLVVDSGKSVAIAVWVNFVRTQPDTTLLMRLTGPAGSYMELGVNGSAGTWRATVEDFSGIVGPTTARAYNVDAWRLIALRLTESTGVVEFWDHGGDPETSTIVGATQAQFTGLTIYGQSSVAMCHVQVYSGPDAYTREMHLARVAAGFGALERQTTGDRIRTLAAYAGLPSGDYANTIDTGTTVMRPATLAGKTPLEAMRDAERTEQGLLYVDGTGRLVFKDRRTLYNI